MSFEGMSAMEVDRWRKHIVDWLIINPSCPSMVCSIDSSKSGCFADTQSLVRVFQMMIDSGELESDDNGWTFRLSCIKSE